jgi:hypothetical protein
MFLWKVVTIFVNSIPNVSFLFLLRKHITFQLPFRLIMTSLGSFYQHINLFLIRLAHQVVKFIIRHLYRTLIYVAFLSTAIVVVLNKLFLAFWKEMPRLIEKLFINKLMIMFLYLMLRYSSFLGEFAPLAETFILVDDDFGGSFLGGSLHNFKIYCNATILC